MYFQKMQFLGVFRPFLQRSLYNTAFGKVFMNQSLLIPMVGLIIVHTKLRLSYICFSDQNSCHNRMPILEEF